MKILTFRVALLVLIVSLLYTCKLKKPIAVDKYEVMRSPLVAYGEQIFKKQACENCHTLEIANESSQLVSLDGVGGKYPNSWLYRYLLDPQLFIPESTKKPYKALDTRPLSQERLLGIDENMSYEDLMKEADIIVADLEQYMVYAKRTEILALISFIQQIAPSEQKVKMDSIRHEKKVAKEKKWTEVFLDSSELIKEIAKDKANIAKGSAIFKANCSICHGQQGQGEIGPNLTDEYWLNGGSIMDIAKTIAFGVPEKGMIAWKAQLSIEEVGALVAFITSIQGTTPERAKAAQGEKHISDKTKN